MMNHYELLGIAPTATFQEITVAYRQAALDNHPDRGGDEAVMKEINEAYMVLRHPDRRAAFDASLVVKEMPVRCRRPRRAAKTWSLLAFYAIAVPSVLIAMYDLWMITLDVMGGYSTPSPWLLVPGVVVALVISRNLRPWALRFFAL